MPIFEFICINDDCNERYDRIVEDIMSYEESEDSPPLCEACGEPMMKKQSMVARMKGSWGAWNIGQ